jgi:hypothetical protein
MAKRSDAAEMVVRLPPDAKKWLEQAAERNWTSQNSEVIRAIRSSMDAEQSKKAAS